MKGRYEFNLPDFKEKDIFALVKNKVSFTLLTLNTIEIIIGYSQFRYSSNSKIVLNINNMSRFFILSDEKFFSYSCPFTFDGENSFFFRGHEITLELVSFLKICMISGVFSSSSLDVLEESEKKHIINIGEVFWDIINFLLLNEGGYIRYDIDTERENGKKHPLNHYDIFYTSKSTLKIGLESKNTESNFIDLLDLSTDCHFIK